MNEKIGKLRAIPKVSVEKSYDCRILLIEKSNAVTLVIRSLLHGAEQLDCDIEHRFTLEECYGELGRGGYELLILDASLLVEEADNSIKELFELSSSSIIVLAEPILENLAQRCLRLGADEYVLKRDLNNDYLTRVVTYILERDNLKRELVAAEKKAEAAQQAKNEFLSIISHEIKTPMNGVIGGLDLLCEFELPEDIRGIVELAQRSAHSHNRLLSDLLDLVSLQGGIPTFQRGHFGVGGLLESAIAGVSFLAESKDLVINKVVEESVPEILIGDERRIRMVLLNLLGNAVKFTESGEVKVTVSMKTAQELRFSVSDTGIGIPEDKFNRIFEVFGQADTSLNREYDGVGLGLAISKRMVEAMGGSIDMRSELDVGSEFIFSVKLDSRVTL
ncbi:ATP-binding protein [Puniceicoccaceae bacterium K14]|nr:ATP-binding protein [Puniceicoccaceae bacterium K14]